MPLNRIEIVGYRGFRRREVLDLAIPNGEIGSGLTILTGPNNSGKSSILECLRARSGGQQTVSFSVGTRNADTEMVEIKYVVDGRDEVLRSLTKGSSETIREGVVPNFDIFVLPSRRAFNPYFHRNPWTREQYLMNSTLPAQRSSVLTNFESRLFTTIKNPGPFNEMLEKVLGFRPEWTIDQSDQGTYFLKFFNGKYSHSSDGMGEGIVSVFAIVDSLHDSKSTDVIVIDEPELSLHPNLQKRLAALLGQLSTDRQIVISTHSPYFVDLQALRNGGNLARITATDNGTRINQLSDPAKASIRRLSEGNIYNPHVFGLDARELFFQEEQIILTEGQEDVLLYPKVAQQVDCKIKGSFFGWGVGGANNITHLCAILGDLGFKKVAALLDGDKTSELAKLKEKFPNYFFDCIPARDIRTKPARKATEPVSGLLDERLNVKPEFIEPLTRLFTALSDHMNS
jgi:energy-coupling factor transporter ATP-binding protein EcfA2